MHGLINVKSPNNISEWQMGLNSAFKGLRSLQRWMLLNTYAAAGDGLQNQKQNMCAANSCPPCYGKTGASPSVDISLKAITFRKNKVASFYEAMPKERKAVWDGHCVAQDGSGNQWQQV
jgi:hypothetical protein